MASDGALLELVARGRKDAFFSSETTEARYWGTPWEKRSPSVRDIRLQNPEGPVRFGHWFDIELPRTLDVISRMDLRIQMPSWLPAAAVARQEAGELLLIESGDGGGGGVTYGWTNSIANYLIPRWGLFVDSLMVVEGFGDFNAWFSDLETTQSRAPILHAMTGTHNGSERSIAANAAPPELSFRVPLPGTDPVTGDKGFPMCAVSSGQRIFVRFWLRPKERLVESGAIVDGSGNITFDSCPSPWGNRRILDGSGDDTGLRTLAETDIKPPSIHARFDGLLLEAEARAAICAQHCDIPFRHQRWETFTIEDKDWYDGHVLKKRLEIHGFFQALFLAIISTARLQQNKFRDISPPGGGGGSGSGSWLQNLSLGVNGQSRILEWPPRRFQELANNTQFPRDVWADLYFLVFSPLANGATPAGACNLSRTQKVELYLRLLAQTPDPATGSSQAIATVLGLSWNVLSIESGRIRVKFAD